MEKIKTIIKIALLIVFSPLVLACYVIAGVLMGVGTLLTWIPVVGSVLFLALYVFMIPIYPIITVYNMYLASIFKEEIKMSDAGFKIIGRRKNKRIKWNEVEKLYHYFTPPGFSFAIEMKNGDQIKLNPITETELLVAEIKAKGITYDETSNFSSS